MLILSLLSPFQALSWERGEESVESSLKLAQGARLEPSCLPQSLCSTRPFQGMNRVVFASSPSLIMEPIRPNFPS